MTDLSGDIENKLKEEISREFEQKFKQKLQEAKYVLLTEYTAKETEFRQQLNKRALECTNLRKTIEKQKQEISDKDKKLKEAEWDKKNHTEVMENYILATKNNTGLKSKVIEKDRKVRNLLSENKYLYNCIADMNGRIRVIWRLRPLNQAEIEQGYSVNTRIIDDRIVEISGYKGKEVAFDAAFGPEASQEQVFDEIKMLIRSSVDGYKVWLLAYGVTGSGKTYTMEGTKDNPGMCMLGVAELFKIVKEKKEYKDQFKISCYMIEIYNENITDLFVDDGDEEQKSQKKFNKITVSEQDGNWVINNWYLKQVYDEHEAFSIYQKGIKNRKTASTNYNKHSSRSHLIFTLQVECTNNQTKKTTYGKLSFVDLAGSENLKHETDKKRTDEGIKVNLSLNALKGVIQSLIKQTKHIPYRNNILTQLLADSLGGSAKTLFFVSWQYLSRLTYPPH
jgi:kinesin family member C2/C3